MLAFEEIGMNAPFRGDARTAAAHVWVAPDTYELAGRLLFGLDPGSPTI